ncbi:MAG: OmpA family protein [Myxococcales bacterium]|nr:OmpA family protein [Myxococcales bacterium]
MKLKLMSFLVVPLAAAACASATRPPVATGAGTEGTARQAAPPPSDTATAVVVDPSIRAACGIEESKTWFDYNSARLGKSDAPVLDAVAKCFLTGPLKGKKMALVGRADPRGEFEYNLVLGGQRADSVKGYVLERGLGSDRVITSSRGEMDARGQDETTWAADRRVDLRLAD